MKSSDLKYFETNKKLWNAKVPLHVASEFYDNESFKNTANSLTKIELAEIGELTGKKVLHLQCHFGQDSISMAKKGAKVTAVDFSAEGLKVARNLAKEMGVEVNFVESNVLTICWLPDLDDWAKIVNHFLADGGRFYMVDFHPFMYVFDFPSKKPAYDYFNTQVYHEKNEGTYAATESKIDEEEYFWNHPLSDIISSLNKVGLSMELFREYDYSPYNCFENLKERAVKEYVFDIGASIPHIYEMKWLK